MKTLLRIIVILAVGLAVAGVTYLSGNTQTATASFPGGGDFPRGDFPGGVISGTHGMRPEGEMPGEVISGTTGTRHGGMGRTRPEGGFPGERGGEHGSAGLNPLALIKSGMVLVQIILVILFVQGSMALYTFIQRRRQKAA